MKNRCFNFKAQHQRRSRIPNRFFTLCKLVKTTAQSVHDTRATHSWRQLEGSLTPGENLDMMSAPNKRFLLKKFRLSGIRRLSFGIDSGQLGSEPTEDPRGSSKHTSVLRIGPAIKAAGSPPRWTVCRPLPVSIQKMVTNPRQSRFSGMPEVLERPKGVRDIEHAGGTGTSVSSPGPRRRLSEAHCA